MHLGLGAPPVWLRRRSSADDDGASPPEAQAVTFVVAGDAPVLVDGMRQWLARRPGWRVVASCRRIADLAEVMAHRSPDVLVVVATHRAHLPSGEIRARCGRMLVVSADVDPLTEAALLREGADAVVSIHADRDELVGVVEGLMAGRSAVSTDAMRIALDAIGRPGLTVRQVEVLELFAMGYSTAQIATQLSLSANTVKTHLRQIAERVGVSGQRALALQARRVLRWEGGRDDAPTDG